MCRNISILTWWKMKSEKCHFVKLLEPLWKQNEDQNIDETLKDRTSYIRCLSLWLGPDKTFALNCIAWIESCKMVWYKAVKFVCMKLNVWMYEWTPRCKIHILQMTEMSHRLTTDLKPDHEGQFAKFGPLEKKNTLVNQIAWFVL